MKGYGGLRIKHAAPNTDRIDGQLLEIEVTAEVSCFSATRRVKNMRTTSLRDEGRSTQNFPASDDQDLGIVSKTRTGISPMESII